MKDLDLTISTINYNTTTKLSKCIDSYLDTYSDSEFSYEWFIFDNNSKAEERIKFDKLIKKYSKYPHLTFIKREDNLGLAVLNTILDKAKGRYWLFLDPDTWQMNKAIKKLKDVMDSHHNMGAVSAMQFKPDGTPLLYFNTHYNLQKFFFTEIALGRLIDQFVLFRKMEKIHYPILYKDLTFNELTEVDQIVFACTMVKMDLLKDDQYVIDPDFSFIFNDVDLCKRIRDKGYKIFIVPSAKIVHDMGSAYKEKTYHWKEVISLKAQMKYFHKYHKNKIWLLKTLLFLDLIFIKIMEKIMRKENTFWKKFLQFKMYQFLY